ncbi:hypothetical protein CK203_107739 [Vitis vinifera]|uniref:C2H2-type domain-containing protein n=1 Tax=Vitis vinifera TaxID=29760 RepID=A0A438C699_VITVI|nr:hypothetical protein CK203_107739 [Vitis vinifera]
MGEAVPCDGEERQGLGSAGLPENWLSSKPINTPMGGGDEVDDGKSNRVIVEARLECNISSKGLGCSEGFKGRMRARLDDQGNRVSRSNKNKTRNLKNGSEGGVAENIGGTDQAKCPVCSKSFHSKKAMYGHMRCHPEREWRGINPPPSAKIASCSSVSQGIDGLSHASMTSTVVSSDISPSQPPLQLTKTGMRGQNRIINSYSSSGSSCNISSSQKKESEEKHQVSECVGLQKRQQMKMLQVGKLIRDYPSKKLKIHGKRSFGVQAKKMLETKGASEEEGQALALPSMPSRWCKIPQADGLQQELPHGSVSGATRQLTGKASPISCTQTEATKCSPRFWILSQRASPNGKRMKVAQCSPYNSIGLLRTSKWSKEGSKLPTSQSTFRWRCDEVDDGKSSKVIVEARLECNISSKGLGCSEGFKGRMRARLDDQGNRVGRSNKNKTRNLKNGSESGVAENIGGTDQAKCPVCSKGFHSKKAMYGHMRCHPEREWRGINPPPSAKIASCSSVSQGIDGLSHASMTSTVVSSDISPSQPPLQLTKTGMRGQNRIINSYSSSGSSCNISSSQKKESEEKHQVSECVGLQKRQQMKMLQVGKLIRDYPSKKLKIHERGLWGSEAKKMLETKGCFLEGFSKTGFNLGPKEVDTDKKSSDDRIIPGGQLDDQISKNTKKTPKFVSYMDVSDNKRFLKTLLPRTYKHGARNKAFPTYQALTMGNKHASSSHTAASEEEGLAVGTSKHAKQVVQKAHKCRTCNKSFPTGQALGGHQTSHRQKPAQLATPRQEALILSDEEASQRQQKHWFQQEAGLDNNIKEESGSKHTTDRSKNRNKLDQEIESESLLVAPRESKCSTCHKVFPTLQALGGHRSSHSYKNNLQAMDSA